MAIATVRDTWTLYEYPALVAINNWYDDNPRGDFPDIADVARMLGRESEADYIGRAVIRLAEAGYIDIQRLMDGTPYGGFIEKITAHGLRAVRAWPSPEGFTARLTIRLEGLAETLEPAAPEKAAGLRTFAAGIGALAKDVGEDIIVKAIMAAAGQ